MYKKINDTTGRRKACSSTGHVKSKEGYIIMEKEKILERREENIKDLYGDNERNEHLRIRTNLVGPQMLKSEAQHAMKRIKKEKAPGLDSINIELLEALKELG